MGRSAASVRPVAFKLLFVKYIHTYVCMYDVCNSADGCRGLEPTSPQQWLHETSTMVRQKSPSYGYETAPRNQAARGCVLHI